MQEGRTFSNSKVKDDGPGRFLRRSLSSPLAAKRSCDDLLRQDQVRGSKVSYAGGLGGVRFSIFSPSSIISGVPFNICSSAAEVASSCLRRVRNSI